MLKYLENAAPYSDIDGAVLIFLPGMADIQELYEILTTERHFRDPKRYSGSLMLFVPEQVFQGV